MENNNYLSSGVNYIPLTVLDKSHSIFINENGGNYDLGTPDGTTVGSVGRHCFGLGAPTQFHWEDNGVYDQAGIHYTEGDSGVFVNNTGDRGIAVWLYFGDNYNPNEAVDSMGIGSEGYTDPSEGLIGYWQRYSYILPNQSATMPWIMDDEVGAQSTRMYFQYVNGYVPGNSLEDWNGTGGNHNLSWSYNNAPTGNVGYGAEDLLPITYENLQEIQTNSSNEGLDSIHIMCMSVTGALLLDASPSNYVMTKDVLILDTDTDVYVDMDGPDYGPFSQMNWGPVSSQYYEIDDLTYATQNGNKIAIGDELTRAVSGDAQYGSHFLLNGLEIRPSSVTYNSATDQTTFVITIDYPAGSEGGDFEVEKFEHYFSRVQAEVITGFVEGSLMEGAKVTAKSKDGETLTVYSDANGKYTFPEPVTGDIIATGGTNTITNETVHDPSNEDIVDDSSDLTTTRAPFKTNAALGGIINAQSTLIVDLMKNHNMNKDTAVDAFIDAGKTLYDLDSDITRQQLNTYLKVGMVGLQNSDSDDTTLYAEMLKTNKAISELEEGFTNGGTSDNATLKEKRKAAVQLRKATTDIISSASKNKLTENANSYLSTAGSDSNLGTIGTNASDTSKNDMLYLINAKAIEEIDSKLTSTAKNLSSKADWKQAAATIVAAVSEKPYKGIKDLATGISYEEIFMHYNESAMRRKAGSNKVYDKKRLGLTPSKTDFVNEADNAMNFRITIVDGNYRTVGSVTDAKGNTKAVSKTGSQRYSDDNMASIKPQISKGGKTYDIVRQGGKLVEVEKTDNTLVVWGRGFARATYVTGETLSNALHSFESSELLINSDEFMLNNKGDRYNGQDESIWFSDDKFESFYPELIGQNDDSVHVSLFKPGYKFVYGSHIKVKDENGNIRNWNLVDFKTGRSITEPGSQEEFNLLEIIENYIKLLNNTNSISEITSLIGNIINEQAGLKRDTDGDGVPNAIDAFPNDATEWGDQDGDGVGDRADEFPRDASETLDTDGDGVGDNSDLFPNDPSRSDIAPWKGTFRVGDSAYGNGSLTLKTWFNSLDNVDIDWGDGQTETFTGGKPQHTYTSAGDYQVSFKFKGTEYWQSNNRSLTSAGDSRKLISIEQWGDFVWNSNMLWGEVVADVTATDVPTLTENFTGFTKSTFTFSAAATTAWENIDLSPVRSIANLFQSCYSGVAQFGIDKWDTSQITTMSNTFSQRSPGDLIRNWNTSNVTNMYGMFASSSVGGDTIKTKVVNLGEANEYIAWDVSKVTSFGSFSSYGNAGSGTLDISNWQINTSAPVNMQSMFFRGGMPMEDLAKKTVTLANGTSYEAWNTSQVTNIRSMFFRSSTAALNIDNASWDTRNVTDMQDFHFSYSGYPIPHQWDRDITGWDLSALINKNLGLFNYNNMNTAKFSTENYDKILKTWDTAGYTDISVNFGKSEYSADPVYFYWPANNNATYGTVRCESNQDISGILNIGDLVINETQGTSATVTGFSSSRKYEAILDTHTFSGAGTGQRFAAYSPATSGGFIARHNLINKGWTITDGDSNKAFASTELELNVEAGQVFRMTFHTGSNTHIDFGDGNGWVESTSYYKDSQPYPSSGIVTVKINQTKADWFWGIDMKDPANNTTSRSMITKVLNWGSNPYVNTHEMFRSCNNLSIIPVDSNGLAILPDFRSAWTFTRLFQDCDLSDQDFSNWLLPNITDISSMFNLNTSFLGNGLENWNTTNITKLDYALAQTLFNKDISGWDVSNVTNFSGLFKNATQFNQDISAWNTSNATDLQAMFSGATSFNQDINTKIVGSGDSAYVAWDTSNNENWNGMFKNAAAFNTPIDKWEIAKDSSSQGMTFMFGQNCGFTHDLLTKDVTIGAGTSLEKTYVAWDVKYIKTFGYGYASPSFDSWHGMFESNTTFNGDISNWDLMESFPVGDRAVQRMFVGATSFNRDLNTKTITNVTGKGTYQAWDISGMTGLHSMLENASSFNQDVSGWDVSNITAINNAFRSTAMDTANYDLLLQAWSTQSVQSGVTINMNNVQYSPGAAATARQVLIDTGWTLTDGGAAPIPMKMTYRIEEGSLNAEVRHANTVRTNAYTIAWGDGNLGDQDNNTHVYTSAGDYQLTITGDFDPLLYNMTQLISVDQWGSYDHYLGGDNVSYGAFMGCTNLEILAEDACVLYGTSLKKCFQGVGTLANANGSMNLWDTSAITDMSYLSFTATGFTADISQWQTDNVTDMRYMFAAGHYRGPYNQFNGNINTKLRADGNLAWNTEKVVHMNNMFHYNYVFNQDISKWNTDSLNTLYAFNSPWNGSTSMTTDFSTKEVTLGSHTYIAWDVRAVSYFQYAFGTNGNGASGINGISNWNTSNATRMDSMFGGVNTTDESWDLSTREVTVGDRTYTAWDTSKVTNMGTMFMNFLGGNDKLNGISTWDVSSLQNMDSFARSFGTFNQDLSGWNTASLLSAAAINMATRHGLSDLDTSFAGWDITNFTSGKGITGWSSQYSILSSISTANYDATLISFASQNVQSGMLLGFGSSKYTSHGAAETARNTLIAAGVTITDGGPVLKEFFYDGGDGESSSSGACSLAATETRGYFYGSGSYPAEGDEIYIANSRSEDNYLAEGYYKIATADNTFSYAYTGGDGSIEEFGECSTSVQYNYGNADRGQEGACNARSLDNTFYVAEEIGEEMPSTLYSDAALTTAINFSRSADGYYPFQLNGSNTRQTFNLSRGRFGAIGNCR